MITLHPFILYYLALGPHCMSNIAHTYVLASLNDNHLIHIYIDTILIL